MRPLVTVLTTWFPTEQAPSRGSFVVRDTQAIAEHAEVRVVHLVPAADDDGSRRLVHDGIDVVRVPMTTSRPDHILRAAAQLPALLKGSDIVHSMAFSSLLPLAIRRPRMPWIHTEHWSALTTPTTLPTAAQLGLPALKQLLRRPDRVTAVCEFLAAPIRAVRGNRPTDIVPCIVEPSLPARRRDRGDGTLHMVSTGGLIPRKDPLLAVDVLRELQDRGLEPYLEWLGDGPLREATLERAREHGVADRLSLPGSVSTDGVREALARADLFFGPTRADNFFVSAAEAIVAGRPVVLGATGGQGEYVTDEIGALVDTQDTRAYTEAILDVDSRTRDRPAVDIAAVIGDRFSSRSVGEAYSALQRRTIDGW